MQDKIYCANPIAQFEPYAEEINATIQKVLHHGPYVLGPEVTAFEHEFAAYHSVKYCIGVGSGTDALTLTLKAFGIASGDEVITVSHTALATASAIIQTGATPVLVDVEEDFYTLDPLKIEAAITDKTKAIIPVHLYGQPCDMDAILTIARKYNLKVIEDCAQAHGALYKGRMVGTMGDAGCFSFYPTKNLGAIGDGGGIITNHKKVDTTVRELRQYGWNADRVAEKHISTVSRLDELQAAILRIKLKYLDSSNQNRQYIAQYYRDNFKFDNIQHPKVREDCAHMYHLYVVRSTEREVLQKNLAAKGLMTGIHYTHPVHMHPAYTDKIRISSDGLAITDKIIKEILTLPLYPGLDTGMIKDRLK